MKEIINLSDEELVELVRSSDQELYCEVVKRYQDKLLRYAERLLQDDQKAQDVVQSSFIKAFVNLKGFDANKKFSSWIYRIVHNEAINYIKKHKREISLDGNIWIKNIKADGNVEKEFSKKEAEGLLLSFLKKLPINYRSSLVLYYFDEKTYEEISDVLKIPMGTVAIRINRGKAMMRKMYKDKESSL